MTKETDSIILKGSREKGTALVIAFIIMGVLTLLGAYFLNFTLTESRIARSQTVGTQTYYLAEAGINKAIWKLKYDDEWSVCFTTSTGCETRSNCDATWTDSFTTSTNALIPNSTTTVTIVSPECAIGEIIATSTIAFGGEKIAQRVVKTGVFKATGGRITGTVVFSGGKKHNEVKIKESKVIITGGNVFSSDKLKIEKKSEVIATSSKILVAKKFEMSKDFNPSEDCTTSPFAICTDKDSTTTAFAICAENICNTTSTCACEGNPEFQECTSDIPGKCPLKPLDMPMLDFDSKATTSYRQQALAAGAAGFCHIFCQRKGEYPYECSPKCVLSDREFKDLLKEVGDGGTLILGTSTASSITYVTGKGNVEVKKDRNLVVNGVLVADKDIKIGKKKGGEKSLLIVNNIGGKPSGLLAKHKVELEELHSSSTITGLLYALEEVKIKKISNPLTIKGGIIGRRKVELDHLQELNLILDDQIVGVVLGNPISSPVITIEYWEETY